MKLPFLPMEIENLITQKFNLTGVYEIRIRRDKPIFVLYYGEYIMLKDNHTSAVYADKKLIDYVLSSLTEMSVYRYNNQIKQGFITTASGVRVGIAGEVVQEESGGVKTIRNINSLVIRVPHEVKGCASPVIQYIEKSGRVLNTLIVSPPGCGKTTMLRDIARALSYRETVQNILVADERYEIAGGDQDIGVSSDVIYGGTKDFAFTSATRALAPTVILTDEIGTTADADAVLRASYSGISVIATAHAKSIAEIRDKPALKPLIDAKIFERYIILSSRRGVGTIELILNQNLTPIAEDI